MTGAIGASIPIEPTLKLPNNHAHAVELDNENGDTKWSDAEKKELGQIDEYSTFEDLGEGTTAPMGYQRIHVHMVYDVKHNGRRKARLVAGGHLTGTPLESVYSSVVSLRGLRLVIFLAELNKLEDAKIEEAEGIIEEADEWLSVFPSKK